MPTNPERAAERLLKWYATNRRDLPWRRRPNPYRVWVSEIMLQQTTVAAAGPYYERFIARYADLKALVAAREDDVLALWSGLGYYHRARNMLLAARIVLERHGGKIPADLASLRALPGVGPYTAGAILSIGHGLPYAALDANVIRVVSRLAAIKDDPAKASTRRKIESLVRGMIPVEDPSSFNQALMDLGATVCLPREPMCGICPLSSSCAACKRRLTASIPAPARAERTVGVHLRAIAVRRGKEVLLVRRSQGALMKGMWEFPMVPEEKGEERPAGDPAAESLGAAITGKVGSLRHTITRHRIAITVYEARPAVAGRPRRGKTLVSRLSEPAARIAPGWEASERRWASLERLAARDADIALTGTARKIARLLLPAGAGRRGAGR